MIFSLETETRFIYCCGPKAVYERDSDIWDRYYIAARMLCLVRPGKDIIILPGLSEAASSAKPYLQALRAYVVAMKSVLGLEDWQTVWTSGRHYVLDKDINDALLGWLIELMGPKKRNWYLVPYAITPEFQCWSSRLQGHGLKVFGDKPDRVTQAGKAILHPPINPEWTNTYPVVPQGIRVPRGYTCRTRDELARAFLRLRHYLRHTRLIVKAIDGAAGEDITPVDSEAELRQLRFTAEGMVIEERLELARHVDGAPQTISIQRSGAEMIGQPTVQLIHNNGWAGGIVPANETPAVLESIAMSEKFSRWHPSTGFTGLDFLVDVEGKAYLVDPNLRMTGMHPAQIFAAIHGNGRHIQVWTTTPRYPIDMLWKALGKKRFAPGEDHHGLIPLCWLHSTEVEQGYGMLLAVGRDRDHTHDLRAFAQEELAI